MIFVHLFYDNFCVTFSLILTLCYILSLPFSLSVIFDQKKRERIGCHKNCHQIIIEI